MNSIFKAKPDGLEMADARNFHKRLELPPDPDPQLAASLKERDQWQRELDAHEKGQDFLEVRAQAIVFLRECLKLSEARIANKRKLIEDERAKAAAERPAILKEAREFLVKVKLRQIEQHAEFIREFLRGYGIDPEAADRAERIIRARKDVAAFAEAPLEKCGVEAALFATGQGFSICGL